MKYSFKELVDVPKLQELTDELYTAVGIPSAIITMDGEVLTGSGWQRICTDFHRQHPLIEKECIESDIKIRKRLDEGEEFVIYECPRGLVDASSPVIIEGEHVANVFAGQLFMEPPDKAKELFFREQARKFGFDEKEYIKAFHEIPTLLENKFRPALSFLSKFAQLVASIGLANLRELDAMEELRTNERKYRRLVESTNTVPWELDLATEEFTYMGPQAERLFGYPLDYWKDMDAWARVIHDEDREWAVNFCMKETKKGSDHEFVYRMYTKDGRKLWIHDVVSVVSGPDGPQKLVGFMHDITDKKKAEEERERLEVQLQQAQKMESIGTLAGGIAHDFNNILFPIVGYTEMMLDDLPEDSPLRNNTNAILQGAKRARDLVKQILKFSRQSDQELKPLFFPLVIKEVLKLIRSSLPSTIEIKQHISNKCGLVMADSAQIHQVALNLMTNAFQAMEDENGKLEVILKEVELGPDDLTNPSMTPGAYVCLTVADTGPGMDQSVINRIFEPYFTTKANGKGTGLGLAIVHGIVKSYKGDIKVYSQPGEGTAFHVYLPVIKSEVEAGEIDTITPAQKGTERILLVDDEEPIVRMEKQMLERLGYDVTERTSSIDALEGFRKAPDTFDLVITDLTMPNMTGDKLAKELINIRSDIPVILCTGFSEKMSKETAEALGFKGYLMKPIIKSDLARTVRRVLDESKG